MKLLIKRLTNRNNLSGLIILKAVKFHNSPTNFLEIKEPRMGLLFLI